MPHNQFNISVRHLIEFVLQQGDLQTGFMGSNRALAGIRGHQKVQQSRPDDYEAEVPLTYRLERDGLQLQLQGRIDGIFVNETPVMLEEIKTTLLDLAQIDEDHNPLHWAQAQCYAYIYGDQLALAEVAIQLTYYQIETQDTKSFRRVYSQAELEIFFESLLTVYLDWARQRYEWLILRDASIDELDFPYAGYRTGQRELAVAVYRTIQRNDKLFVQAPTGIGKTIATLFPTVKGIGTGLVNKIFYLTAKTLGRTVAEKAVADMRQVGLHLKCVTLTAKDKICFCPASARNGDSCDYARNYYGKVREALTEAYQYEAFTRLLIEELAEKHQVCPFEFSLDLAVWVDCVICDYNYAFDPRVYLRRFFDNVSESYVFLIDESHNFPDRAREMFSAQLERNTLLDLKIQLDSRQPKIAAALGRIEETMFEKLQQCQASRQPALVETDPPENLLGAVRGFIITAEAWLVQNQPAEFREALLDFYFQCNAYLRTGEQFGPTYVSYFEPLGATNLLARLYCLDPAPHLKEPLGRSRANIFFSATLWPIDYFTRILTGATKQPALALASPFPRENTGLMIHNRISTKYAGRETSYPEIATTIAGVCAARQGNYLVFFPSYRYLEAVAELVRQQSPQLELLVQEPGMAEAVREEFLAQFSTDNGQTLVGFAVMGGIFGEGIDLVGERLIGAIVVGVGLPQLCLERDLIKEYFQLQNRRGFEYAYQYPGLNRVMQAAGRVIRTETDQGIIVLLDERFTQYRYRQLFPKEWRGYKTVPDSVAAAEAARAFWK